MSSTDLALPSEGISTTLIAQHPPGPRKEEPQFPLLQPVEFQYSSVGYSRGLTYPKSSNFRVADSMAGQGDVLALPAMPAGYPTSTTTSIANQGQGQGLDTTGQVAPPGVKPNVTATLWEDEGSLCFQVQAKEVCVARREGNPEQVPFPTIV
jgi:protein SOK2